MCDANICTRKAHQTPYMIFSASSLPLYQRSKHDLGRIHYIISTLCVKHVIPDMSSIRLSQHLRIYCDTFRISFAADKTTVPRKFQAPLPNSKRTRNQIDYELSRLEELVNDALYPTDALLLWTNKLTVLLCVPTLHEEGHSWILLIREIAYISISTKDAPWKAYRVLCSFHEIAYFYTMSLSFESGQPFQKHYRDEP